MFSLFDFPAVVVLIGGKDCGETASDAFLGNFNRDHSYVTTLMSVGGEILYVGGWRVHRTQMSEKRHERHSVTGSPKVCNVAVSRPSDYEHTPWFVQAFRSVFPLH